MGSLRIPAGPVGIDTSTLIYTIEQRPDFAPLLRPLWEAVGKGSSSVVISDLVWLEAFVLPIRNQDHPRIDQQKRMLAMPNIHLAPITKSVLLEAARLRATVKIDTADSIHAATALAMSCQTFITNDIDFRNVPGLSVQLLKDFVTP